MKLKKIIGIISFVLLFAFVVYIKTTKKLKRTGVIKEDNIEQVQYIIESQKEAEKQYFQTKRENEQNKRDSIQQLQLNKLEEQRKKSEEIIKALDKEIEDKEN